MNKGGPQFNLCLLFPVPENMLDMVFIVLEHLRKNKLIDVSNFEEAMKHKCYFRIIQIYPPNKMVLFRLHMRKTKMELYI